jgi:GntR family transcriptional regulator
MAEPLYQQIAEDLRRRIESGELAPGDQILTDPGGVAMVVPMYRLIAEDLRNQIEAGELAAGEQLRTELELREKYNASRNTVRNAIKWLITRGLVETPTGPGHLRGGDDPPFVTTLTGGSGGRREQALSPGGDRQGRNPQTSVPRVEIQKAETELGGELDLEEGATVVSRHRQYRIDGTPWSLQTSFYPLRLVQQGATRLIDANDIQEGAVEYLRETVGIKQAGYRVTITVRALDGAEARFSGFLTTAASLSLKPAGQRLTRMTSQSGSPSAHTQRTGISSPSTSAKCPKRL